MPFWEILLTGVALSMDAVAVSMSYGVCMDGTCTRDMQFRYMLKIALFFGAFQAIMPALGWLAGTGIRQYIEQVDHWIAFVLLAAIGGKMIRDNLKKPDGREAPLLDARKTGALLVMAIATSIDALAVGIGLAMTDASVGQVSLTVGLTTFILSLIGVGIGNRVGRLVKKGAGILGGVILIGIGLKILIEHLMGG